ncbi:MAG: hypothetical protein ACRD4X_09000 [Candidatus Acidiferrales bacterium]
MSRPGIRRTSTFTRNKILGIVLAALCSGCLCATLAQAREDNKGISREIANLGRGNDNFAIVEDLARSPDRSVPLLVEELHPIQETRILASESRPQAEHVLWCLRALRYLCGGRDFCAKTNYAFGDSALEQNRRYWLYFRYHTCVSFFAMWPSRGSVYIAPADAQSDIIRAWKSWLRLNAADLKCKPLLHAKPGQWLW